ncbi:chorismate-binding protein [Pseudozobellia thermophila]|uniref:Isochorismate synthase n=1 Tax=Pseudozobellia thermophila TaxID=192903 RepID=A0A1M6LDZ9_9FLAO|nr:chorismate-binding protein [Pseudozobellia thermophila]SHJ69305.1 isochorismate synthase [Pseudozobellia thermophila]
MTEAEFFEEIKAQFSQKLPLVVYRKPKEDTLCSIFQNEDSLLSVNNFEETGFVFAPFDQEGPVVLLRPDRCGKLPGYTPRAGCAKKGRRPVLSAHGKGFHLDLVRKGLSEIRSGVFDKVVLSRSFSMPTEAEPLDLFKNLVEKYQNAFCYLWYHPKVGMWLGATPEILLNVRNRTFTTMSLAGTQVYRGDENPEWGEKELTEQKYVTDYILDALKGRVDDLKHARTETVRAGKLLHLRTKISGRLKDSNLAEILSALHPTPAVCGLPKESTRKFIVSHEDYPREFYTGYLGELNFQVERKRNNRASNPEVQVYKSISRQTTLFVNLRCLKLEGSEIKIYVGGGVTKESDPEKEWEETVSKSRTMLDIL